MTFNLFSIHIYKAFYEVDICGMQIKEDSDGGSFFHLSYDGEYWTFDLFYLRYFYYKWLFNYRGRTK